MLSQEAAMEHNNDDCRNYYEEISTSNLITSASPSSRKLDEEAEAIRSHLRSFAASIAMYGSCFFCIEVMSIFMATYFLYFRAFKSDDIVPPTIEMVYGILAVLSVKSITCHGLRRLLNYWMKSDSMMLPPNYGQGEYTPVKTMVLGWKNLYLYLETGLLCLPYVIGLLVMSVFFIFDPNPTFIHDSFEWEHGLLVGLVAAGGLYLAANATYILTIILKFALSPSKE